MNEEAQIEEKEMIRDIESMLTSFEKDRYNLMPILQAVQKKYRYLSAGVLKIISRYLDISTCEVYGVATFYNQFRFHPPGKHHIDVCLGTACHVKGGDIILENFVRKLEIEPGETTPDREFSIDRVACVGCCALAPVAVMDDKVYGRMAPSKVEGLLLGLEIEKEKETRKKESSEST